MVVFCPLFTRLIVLAVLGFTTWAAADDLEVLRTYPEIYSLQTGAAGQTREQRVTQAHALLATRLSMTPEAVAQALKPLVEKLRQDKAAAKVDRARASFAHGTYAEAQTLALEAGDAAHRAQPRQPEQIIAALQLAAFSALEISRFEDAVKYLSVALGEAPADRDLKTWTRLQSATARAYGLMKMYKDEEQTVRLIYTEHERLLGARNAETIKHHSEFAGLLYQNGRDTDAERETRAVLRTSESLLGPVHEQTQVLRKNLARVLEVQGRHAEAETLRRKVVAGQMETLGGGAAATLRSREQLVKNLFEQKKFGDAETEAMTLVDHSTRATGPDTLTTLSGRVSVVLAVFHQGKHEQALKSLGVLEADCIRVLGAEHADTLRVQHAKGACLNSLKKYAEAEAALARAFEGRKRTLPVDDFDTLDTQHQLGIARLRGGKLKEALADIRIVANSYQRLLKPGDPRLDDINKLANEFTALPEAKLILMLEQSEPVEELARKLGEDHLEVLNARANLAAYLNGIGAVAAAADQYETALAGCLRALGRKHLGTVDVMQRLAMTQQSLGKFDEAAKNYRAALELRPKLVKAGDLSVEELRYRLGLCLGMAGKLREAQPFVEESFNAVKDRKDVNSGFLAEMKNTLDQIRVLRTPQPMNINVPGTLQQPVSLSTADKTAPVISTPGAATTVPAANAETLVPAGTIQKPVEYKP